MAGAVAALVKGYGRIIPAVSAHLDNASMGWCRAGKAKCPRMLMALRERNRASVIFSEVMDKRFHITVGDIGTDAVAFTDSNERKS